MESRGEDGRVPGDLRFNIQRGDLRFNQLKIEDGQGQGDVNSYSGWAPVDVNAGQMY